MLVGPQRSSPFFLGAAWWFDGPPLDAPKSVMGIEVIGRQAAGFSMADGFAVFDYGFRKSSGGFAMIAAIPRALAGCAPGAVSTPERKRIMLV